MSWDQSPESEFQSTRPREARPERHFKKVVPPGFNPRAHGRRDDQPESYVTVAEAVSIHAPTGGATNRERAPVSRGRVSIHAPTGGATSSAGRRKLTQEVSIHAPTGGATFTGDITGTATVVSIHAPTGGATTLRIMIFMTTVFQSTRPREARLRRR